METQKTTIDQNMRESKEFQEFLQRTQLYQAPKAQTCSEIEFREMLKEPLFECIDHRKSQLQNLLCELLKLNREVTRISFSITSTKERIEFQNIMLESQKYAVEADSSIDTLVRQQAILDTDERIGQNLNNNDEVIFEMEEQKKKVEQRLKCCVKDLGELKKVFEKEHKMMVEKINIFMTKVSPGTVLTVKEKLKYLEDNYKREMHALNEYENKFADVVMLEGPCMEQPDIADHTESSSSSDSTCSSPKNAFLSIARNEDIKKDHDFIKAHLAKPLIQGMAAITIYQPTDAIYFLSNFLLHYQHNEMMNCRKEMNFQLLMEQRKGLCQPKETSKCVTCANMSEPNELPLE